MINRICMLSTHGYFDPVPQLGKTDTGGQVLYVLQLAKALNRCGARVDIYTRWFDREKQQVEPLPGCPEVRVIRIPAGPWQFISKEHIYDVLPELAQNMSQFMRENQLDYDLFHGHYVDAGMVALEVAKEFEKPAFFTSHSLGAWKKQRSGGNPEKMERIFNFSRRIAEELRIFQSVTGQTVTSKEEAEKIEELYDFRPPQVEFIPPGVDIHRFRPLKEGEEEEQTAIQLPQNYIFLVGRVSKAKGHDLLIPAFARVAEQLPDIHLVMAGWSPNPEGEERDVLLRVKRLIKKCELEDKVHILERIPNEELPPYFRGAQLFALPSRYEPFGMTALEAMACQVPAVITKFSGVHEHLTSGVHCLLIDPFNADEYAQAVISLLRDRALAQKLAKAGYQLVHNEFSWEAIAEKHLSFYEKCLRA